jgi:methionyl-tRNA synthetase
MAPALIVDAQRLKVKEESYFLRLTKYADQLLTFIHEHPNFIQPETRKNEVISFIEQGLEDLCVSRTSFQWGIPVRSNPKHVVIYVWIDALSNYLSVLGYKTKDDSMYQKILGSWRTKWFMSLEKIFFVSCVYWPIMLLALGSTDQF